LAFSGQAVRYIPPAERFYAGGANSVRGFGQNQLGPVVRVLDPAVVDTTIVFQDSAAVAAGVITAATGGNSLLIANAELRFPLPGFGGRLGGALFMDMGELIERGATLIDLSEMRFTPGAGIRIATPIGPVRLDVAYNGYAPQQDVLYIKEGQQLREHPQPYPRAPASVNRLQFHFSVGQAF
jgi:outer membrane protein assembly factor BamA